MTQKAGDKWEYGDFQTPSPLAEAAITVLRQFGVNPRTVLEPTCGKGAFLLAAIQAFPDATRFVGIDLNKKYLTELQEQVSFSERRDSVDILHGIALYTTHLAS